MIVCVMVLVVLLMTGAGYIKLKGPDYSNQQPMPDAGAYRTATTFKAPIPKTILTLKEKRPMNYATKVAIAIVWNTLLTVVMVMIAGVFWGVMSTSLAFASVVSIVALVIGSSVASACLVEGSKNNYE